VTKVIAIAATAGFAVPIAWLVVIWGFVLSGHESLISGEWFSTLSKLICPPFFLQFTILAPVLNAGMYALGAYIFLLIIGGERKSTGVH